MEKNNSLYIDKLSEKMELKKAKVSMIIETFVLGFAADLNTKTRIGFEPFGTFEVNKHLEYIEDKDDGTRVLYPPRLEVVFSSSALAGVLLSSSEEELESTYKELKDRYNWESSEVALFIAHLKSTLKSQLLQEKKAFIPAIGAFEGELGGDIHFTADPYFANLVNKPFSYFEPEVLSPEQEESDEPEVLPQDAIASVEVLSSEDTTIPVPHVDEKVVDESVASEDALASSDMKEMVATDVSQEKPSQVVESSDTNNHGKRDLEFYALEKLLNDKDKQIKYYRRLSLLLIVLILLLIVGVFYYWSNTLLPSASAPISTSINQSAPEELAFSLNDKDINLVAGESISQDEPVDVVVSDSVVVSSKKDSLSSKAEDIVLTEDEPAYLYHTLKRGETLRNIAYKYYKDYDLWPMLVSENKDVIRDPNKVPVGQTIKIPVKK